MPADSRKLAERFWRWVTIPTALQPGDNSCWLWNGPGSTTNSGHVRICWPVAAGASNGRTSKAYVHRVAWTLGGEPLGDRILRHWACSNPRCVRNDHLSPYGGHLANARDRDSLGNRQAPAGEHNGRARLTQVQAEEIRAAWAAEVPVTLLALEYDVGVTTVRNVLAGRTYRAAGP